MYDYLIVGAGFFGATFAREAHARGHRCLVIDQRPHIAGNAYTHSIANIQVHQYGPHIFNTSNDAVWAYVNQFAPFNRFTNAPLASHQGRLYNLPINLNTLYQLWGVRTPAEARQALDAQRAPHQTAAPSNLEQQALSLVGPEIYETLIKHYTEKQWGRPCHALPASIINRLPIRFRFDNNYFNTRHQGIPEGGYTALIAAMLDGIETRLDTDYLTHRATLRPLAGRVVYTGPIDAYFDYALGPLAYRSLCFDTQILDLPDFQGNAVVNYTDAQTPYTRIVEHKHFTFGDQPQTVVSYEYPLEWAPGATPYYPVNDASNQALYARYTALARSEPDVLFGGRLGEYRYYNMDQVVKRALLLAQEVL